ncbi:MAG: UDP-N-acetylglucosamine 2-epimerase [Salibacteraceae bacterium]|nr:UDP-N-acetylglucosamine 2-epimerase [Salibacteraceae bacterium]|tara:strand:- start:4818 stop:5918 length:1101 start_codon:yes stop_codon:yes gene_type:complete
MKLGLLTSSRADYGIYQPLIQFIEKQSCQLEVIAFGAHTSIAFGNSVTEIEKTFNGNIHKLDTFKAEDSSEGVALNYAKTAETFSSFWSDNKFDLVLCLGDRYEMFAAVSAGAFFHQKFAHIHGGEETTGAFDNMFRHSLTQFCDLHFTSAEVYSQRIAQLRGSLKNVHTVGALALDSLSIFQPFTKSEMLERFKVDFSIPSILITFHPETMLEDAGRSQLSELIKTFKSIENYQLVITQTNADIAGLAFRKIYEGFAEGNENVRLIESFGLKGYFSAITHSEFMLGNTSSGVIEAASFNKRVINLGNRQKGRVVSNNVTTLSVEKSLILKEIERIEKLPEEKIENIYWKGGAVPEIWNAITNYLA